MGAKCSFVSGILKISSNNATVALRYKDHRDKGVIDKLEALQQFLNIFSLSKDEVAFMGDDIIDIPVLKAVGYSGTPADARKYIKEIVNFVAPNKGGDGAFRDFADHILEAKGLLQKIIEQPV